MFRHTLRQIPRLRRLNAPIIPRSPVRLLQAPLQRSFFWGSDDASSSNGPKKPPSSSSSDDPSPSSSSESYSATPSPPPVGDNAPTPEYMTPITLTR